MLWAHVQAMRADAHTHGPIVRRRDEKFIVLMISIDSREEVNMSPLFLSAHLFQRNTNFQQLKN